MANGGITGTIHAVDERPRINISFDNPDAGAFTLYYNPADPYFYDDFAALEEMQSLDIDMNGVGSFADVRDRMKPLTDALNTHFDAIFGDGAARKVFRHGGAKMTILHDIIAEMRNGMNEFNKAAEKEQAKERAKVQAAAKAEAAAFVAGK